MRHLAIFILSIFLGTSAQANVLGDMQTFVPNTDGLDFITVHSSRPLNEGFFAIGGHFSYAKDHLQVFRTLPGQELLNYSDQLVEFDTDLSYAFTKRFGAFIAVPFLLWQESKSGQDVDVEVTRGMHSFRPGFKYTLGDSSDSPAIIGSIDFLNLENSPYTGVDPKPIYNIELAKNWAMANRVTYGTNLGYRLREPTATPADAQMFPLDDQITFSVARSAPLWAKTGWVAEAFFSLPVDKDPYNETVHASSVDLLLGIKHRLRPNLNIDAGATIEPFVESQSPHFRVFTGIVYYFKPDWSYSKKPATPVEREEVVIPAATVDSELAALANEGETLTPGVRSRRGGGLTVEPQYVEVFEGATVDFDVDSDNEPITMELIQGGGYVYDSEFRYRAAVKAGSARIRFTDSVGNVKISRVVIKPIPKADKTVRIKNLNFVFDTANLIDSSKVEIRKIVQVLKTRKVRQIIVEGHTDSLGSDKYNLELSERRAKTVKDILVEELKLRPDQVLPIGFGESRPVATNNTDAGRQANRRVDLKIYYQR